MNVIFPMAGFGTRFLREGFTDPKPFVKVLGKTLLEWSIGSLGVDGTYHLVFRDDLPQHYVDLASHIIDTLGLGDSAYMYMTPPTKGALETAMVPFKHDIELDEPLIITNCDQYTPWHVDKFAATVAFGLREMDAVVTTYYHEHITIGKRYPYSFIKFDEDGRRAVEVAEKLAISTHSLNGIHFWREAKTFFESATAVLENADQYNTELYLSTVFNHMIQNGLKVGAYQMKQDEFCSLGTPDEIKKNVDFLRR